MKVVQMVMVHQNIHVCLIMCKHKTSNAVWLQEEGVTLTAAAAKEASGTASDKERRLQAVSQKQDRLLYLCSYLLLNLSEDPDIERKMQKKVASLN